MTSCGEGSPVGWSEGGGGRAILSGRALLSGRVALGEGSVFWGF